MKQRTTKVWIPEASCYYSAKAGGWVMTSGLAYRTGPHPTERDARLAFDALITVELAP